MKVAICYFGITGFTDGKADDGTSLNETGIYSNNIEKLIAPNNADVFIHSWSTDAQNLLTEYYEPKRSQFEDMKPLHKLVDTPKIPLSTKEYIRNIVRHQCKHSRQNVDDFYRASSRWLSNAKAIHLALQHDIDYDLIISLRLDIIFNRTFILPENMTDNQILVSHWNDAYINGIRKEHNFVNHTHEKRGFLDLWFGGTSTAMANFSEIFDQRYAYSVSPHLSSFQHCEAYNLKPRFELYRGYDYELYRRQVLQSKR